jgi:hypothetical protein
MGEDREDIKLTLKPCCVKTFNEILKRDEKAFIGGGVKIVCDCGMSYDMLSANQILNTIRINKGRFEAKNMKLKGICNALCIEMVCCICGKKAEYQRDYSRDGHIDLRMLCEEHKNVDL